MSLLNQTYPFVRIVVVNDGDPDSPWPVLADIADSRLVRFDLPENRGPYFCLAVTAMATDDPFFLVQDADDLSSPRRVEALLELLDREQADFAFSSVARFRNGRGSECVPEAQWFVSPPDATPKPTLQWTVPHLGLFKTASIEAVGGYFGGFRFGYDLFLTNILMMLGTIAWTPEPLYWHRVRAGSLTTARQTGHGSAQRQLLRDDMEAIYSCIYQDYLHFVNRRLDGQAFLERVRGRVHQHCGLASMRAIEQHAIELRQIMHCDPQKVFA
jgi:glycosyltransferase involved in cell wall biosynthesis